ncbi:TonB-dependent receptor domain-containing protein [Thalassotalea agariperforans]
MRYNFKLTAVSAAILASMSGNIAIAEEEKKADEPAIEVIEVTGFKGSLRKAMNAKRFADGVSDSIHAEDVGKSTDQNIADALSRVTGVTVQEGNGEGARISVRGTNSSMNQISMNGVALTGGLNGDGSTDGTTADNSVDLSTFSSDILSSIDVLKTAAADQDEGSLGANIVLRTVRPLNLNDNRRVFSLEQRFDDYAGKDSYRLSGSISEKFLDDSLGFIFTASKDTSVNRSDRMNSSFYEFAQPIADAMTDDPSGRRAIDAATGKAIRILGEGQTTADLADWDPDTQIAHDGDLNVLVREGHQLGSNLTHRERVSVSTGIQFQPTDDLDIQLDLTHSSQKVSQDSHTIAFNYGPDVPLLHETDPTEWNAVDLTTNTLQKSLSRSHTGSLQRYAGDREVETNVATITIEHNITDDLTANLLVGYSKTTDETPDANEAGRFIALSTNTWGGTTREIIEGLDETNPNVTIEPVGFDCSQGDSSQCSLFSGTTFAEIDALDGTINNATSRFNPLDLNGNHLGSLTLRDNKQSDTNKSLFLDFNWAVEFYNITGLEFGAKYYKRTKEVNIQNHIATTAASLVDENNGNQDFQLAGFGSINLNDMMSGNAFPFDDFGDGVVDDRSNEFFQGWPMLDGEKTLQAITNRAPGTVGFREAATGSREMETETKAAYFKVNFEFMDGRLTGNIGTRYVKDESVATGVGGINFIRFPQVVDPYDLLVTRGLATIEGQDPCPQAIAGNDFGTDTQNRQNVPANDADLRGCYAWQVSHAYNYTEDATIPVDADGNWIIEGPDGTFGPHVNRLVWGAPTADGITQVPLPSEVLGADGVLYSTSQRQNRDFSTSGEFWPFIDRSTSFANGVLARDDFRSSVREAVVTNTGGAEVWLPSLNLNYAINDEMIGRFAVSKTMTRPQFDSLNPRTQIREIQWGPSVGSAGNTNLQPLESNNIDLSYEWYFSESGLLSAALFFKDMKNFERTVTTPYHYKDVRTEYDLDSADLLLDYDADRQVGDADGCMPHRQSAGFFREFVIACDTVNIEVIKNGAGSSIKGLELAYTQNYDFLPGNWSGLGASINYTYQKSESDAEAIGTSGLFTQPLPQPFTPMHSANSTLFWEKDGFMVRLAHRWTDEQLVDDGLIGGTTWQDASGRFDISSSYQYNKNVMFTFQATNLTDETRRLFFTAKETRGCSDCTDILIDEGNVLDDDSISRERTTALYRTGRQFRFGVRVNF